tara:strand:+ start:219 stop:665 length:447 start_codon:yes stop_codon:yes gene_type:complete
MIDHYLGIDPGKSGAICSIDSGGNATVVTKTDKTYRDIWNKLNGIGDCVAVIELVNAMPNQGVVSTFKFGESFGLLLGLLTAAGISFERVRPAVWCKEFGLKKKKEESNTDWKNRHKQLAQELFPDVDVTHATADALLIAEYCRRKNK